MNLQEDIKRKGLMTEIVSRLGKLEVSVRKLLSASSGSSVPVLASGTYTPTVTAVTNIT
jgi:hypothetical protein